MTRAARDPGPLARVALGVSHRSWAQELLRHVADHGGASVAKRVLTEEDALDDPSYDVLVVDDVAPVLTPGLVGELHRRERRVLAVRGPDVGAGDAVLRRAGVDSSVEEGTTPEDLLAAIRALVPRRDAGGMDGAFDEIARGLDAEPPPEEAAAPAPWRGQVVTVLSVSGGCGATETALAVAAALGHRGEATVLVDADEVAPSLAQRSGRPLVPNLRSAVDAVAGRVGRLEDALVPVATGRDGRHVALLCGLSNPADWPEVSPDQVAAVVAELARGHRHVVVNAASRSEDVTAMSGLARYGVTRAMLAAADQVVLVAAPTPVGVARLLDWLGRHAEVARSRPLHLLLNRAPHGAFRRAELEREVVRNFLPTTLHFAPVDKRVEEAAWDGRVVHAGPFARTARALAGAVVAAGQRRGSGLVVPGGSALPPGGTPDTSTVPGPQGMAWGSRPPAPPAVPEGGWFGDGEVVPGPAEQGWGPPR